MSDLAEAESPVPSLLRDRSAVRLLLVVLMVISLAMSASLPRGLPHPAESPGS
jgi:hypothetical protein